MSIDTDDKRRVRDVLGRIDPLSLYTREGCMFYGGIGDKSLLEAKESGIVKPIYSGKRVYYRGKELIEWIESHNAK